MNGVIAKMKLVYFVLILSACGSPDQMPYEDLTSTGGSSSLAAARPVTGGSSSTGGQGNTTTGISQDASTSPDQTACEAILTESPTNGLTIMTSANMLIIQRCAPENSSYGNELCAIACNVKACYGLLYNYNQNLVDVTANSYINAAKIYGVIC